MGTHPIFESDFDCLTEWIRTNQAQAQQQQPAQRRQYTTEANQELAQLFECPVCFDYVLPPIMQCNSGHLVCQNCQPKLTHCPTCRGQAATIYFPCKYHTSGCHQSFLHDKKAAHEETCEFRPYHCPCPGASCKWQGNLDGVMDLLLNVHKTITTLQGDI